MIELVERNEFSNDIHTAAVEYCKDAARSNILSFLTAIFVIIDSYVGDN